jgi:hypothetical protein
MEAILRKRENLHEEDIRTRRNGYFPGYFNPWLNFLKASYNPTLLRVCSFSFVCTGI